MNRICPECRCVKPPEGFQKAKFNSHGYRPICDECKDKMKKIGARIIEEKLKKCLKCDRVIVTTTNNRICYACNLENNRDGPNLGDIYD